MKYCAALVDRAQVLALTLKELFRHGPQRVGRRAYLGPSFGERIVPLRYGTKRYPSLLARLGDGQLAVNGHPAARAEGAILHNEWSDDPRS